MWKWGVIECLDRALIPLKTEILKILDYIDITGRNMLFFKNCSLPLWPNTVFCLPF